MGLIRRRRRASFAAGRTAWLMGLLDRNTALDSGDDYTVLA
jgi:hypothetical protein